MSLLLKPVNSIKCWHRKTVVQSFALPEAGSRPESLQMLLNLLRNGKNKSLNIADKRNPSENKMPSKQQEIVPTSSYIPELDGIRAFAIVSVMFYHAGFLLLNMGWCGVQLFFVLSGFLITGILLDSKKKAHYFRTFYFRRTLRIFPAYYFLLVLIAITAPLASRHIGDLPWYLVYLQNYLLGIRRWKAIFPNYFNHSWSLAVEEQFYLIWPLIVLLCSRKQLFQICIGIIPGTLLFRFLVAELTGNDILVYASLPCQIDYLAIGGLLAIILRRGITRGDLARLGTRTALIALIPLVIFITVHRTDPFRPSFVRVDSWLMLSAMAFFFAGAVAIAASGLGIIGKVLRLKPLIHIGKISYGLYLYHLPCYFIITRIVSKYNLLREPASVPIIIGILIAKFGFAYLTALLSWNYLEKPFLTLKNRFFAR